jgi:hypothetical protein
MPGGKRCRLQFDDEIAAGKKYDELVSKHAKVTFIPPSC